MTNIDGPGMGFTELNEAIRNSDGVCRITGLLGQRFLCAGMSDRSITLEGIPGNALGAYVGGLPIGHGLGYEYTALPGAAFVLLGMTAAMIYIRKYPRHEKR